jgi:hypothetical protein
MRKARDPNGCYLTPWLHVQCHDRLRSGLRLALLLLLVLGQPLLPDTGSLSIFLLIIRTKEIDVVIVLSLSLSLLRGFGRVQCEFRRLWAVGGSGLAWITGQSGEL